MRISESKKWTKDALYFKALDLESKCDRKEQAILAALSALKALRTEENAMLVDVVVEKLRYA